MAGGENAEQTKRTAEEAKCLRRTIDQFKSAAKFVAEQENQNLVDVISVKLRIEELQKCFDSYRNTSVLLMSVTDEDPDDKDEDEDNYLDVMSKLRKLLEDNTNNGNGSRNNNSTPPQHNKLPQLEITTFDGRQITDDKPFMDISSGGCGPGVVSNGYSKDIIFKKVFNR